MQKEYYTFKRLKREVLNVVNLSKTRDETRDPPIRISHSDLFISIVPKTRIPWIVTASTRTQKLHQKKQAGGEYQKKQRSKKRAIQA